VVVGWSQTKNSNPHAMMWRVNAEGAVTTTDLGLMPGEAQSMATAVNDSLQVAGFGRTYQMRKMQLSQSAFLWQNGAMQDLRQLLDLGGLLAGRNMEAYGLNNAGLIVGFTVGDATRYPFIAIPLRQGKANERQFNKRPDVASGPAPHPVSQRGHIRQASRLLPRLFA